MRNEKLPIWEKNLNGGEWSIKINYEDIQYILKNPEGHLLINTLSEVEQECLILNTTNIKNEENIINKLIKNGRKDIKIIIDQERMRPIDADYQMFNNKKIQSVINWKPEIPVKKMFMDLLNHWRKEIAIGKIPLNR